MSKVLEFCAAEVHRQGDDATFVPGMVYAWNDAHYTAGTWIETGVTHDDLFRWNGLITKREVIRYRTTPVYFAGGSTALNARAVPDTMDRFVGTLSDLLNADALISGMVAEQMTKWFLDIHPFEDGNGRVACIVYNLLLQSMDDPIKYPDFYA